MNCIDTDQKALASLKNLCKVFIQETNKPLNSQGCEINDQSPNIKILKVPSDFPIKYGPKTLKNP